MTVYSRPVLADTLERKLEIAHSSFPVHIPNPPSEKVQQRLKVQCGISCGPRACAMDSIKQGTSIIFFNNMPSSSNLFFLKTKDEVIIGPRGLIKYGLVWLFKTKS